MILRLIRIYHDGKQKVYNHPEQISSTITDYEPPKAYTLNYHDWVYHLMRIGFSGIEAVELVFEDSTMIRFPVTDFTKL